jgi:signal peptidase I
MSYLINFVLAVLFLPIVLSVEALRSKRRIFKRILYVLVAWLLLGATWVRGYMNLYEAAKYTLYDAGLIDENEDVPVSGRSMLPTILDGSTVTLKNPNKYKIERGDIVSFSNIETGGRFYLKRVIGLAGDRVSFVNGKVLINDKILVENYIYQNAPTYGNTYLIDCKTYTVPEGSVMVLGDNRIASTDSRVVGFVAKKDVEGVMKTGVSPGFLSSFGEKPQALGTVDVNSVIDKLNKKRNEMNVSALMVNDLLNQAAKERVEFISGSILNWKKEGADVAKLADKLGYDYLLVQEVVTMGAYTEDELAEHLLELHPYSQDILSENYYEIGMAVSNAENGECTIPVIVVALGWPATPNYSQDVAGRWKNEIDNLSQLLTNLRKLKGATGIENSELDPLIDTVSVLLETADDIHSVVLENRWPTEGENQILDDYQEKTTEVQKELSQFVSNNRENMVDDKLKDYFTRFKWGNPEFNEKANEAKLLFGQGKYEEQLTSAQELLQLATNDSEKAIAYYWEGLAYYNLGNETLAEASLKDSVSSDIEYAAPYVTLSAISFNERDYDKGLEYAIKCVELDENYGWCHNNLGLAYAYLGEKDKAISELEKAVELDTQSYVFNDNLKRVKGGL